MCACLFVGWMIDGLADDTLSTSSPLPTVVQDLKEEVLAYERLLLHVIGFNLYMDLPDYVGTMKQVKGAYVALLQSLPCSSRFAPDRH